MDPQRQEIIINEIMQWRKSKLLPERYCDFLLALYSGGEGQSALVETKRNKIGLYVSSVILIAIMLVSVFFIYFTELSLILQMALGLLLLLSSITAIFYFFKKGFSPQIPLASAAFIFLILSSETASRLYSGNQAILYAALVSNCLIWIFIGKKYAFISFLLSGLVGLGLLIIYIFI